MNQRSLVSIVIPTYHREEVLCNTLLYILDIIGGKNVEIIVVDQTENHEPATSAFLQELAFKELIRYYYIQPPSLPGAKNYGAGQAKGNIVLFLDDDIIPSPGLVDAHLVEYSDPCVGAVAGCRTFLPETGIREAQEPIGVINCSLYATTNFSSPLRKEHIQWGLGGNFSCRKELIGKIGGFETHYLSSFSYEDVDYSFRVRKAGYRIVYSPDAHFIHLIEKTGGCENRKIDLRLHYGWFHNSFLFALRNMSILCWAAVFSTRLITCLSLVKQYRSLSPLLAFLRSLPVALVSYLSSRDTLILRSKIRILSR